MSLLQLDTIAVIGKKKNRNDIFAQDVTEILIGITVNGVEKYITAMNFAGIWFAIREKSDKLFCGMKIREMRCEKN